MIEQIAQWVLDARSNLSTAKTICGKANNILKKTNQSIHNRNLSLTRTNYYLDSMKQQLQILELIKESLFMYEASITKQNASIDDLVNNQLNNLDKILSRLLETNIDIAVTDEFETLHDFISIENINFIKLKLSKIKSNREKFYKLLMSQNESVESIFDELDTKYKEVESHIENLSHEKQLSQLVADNELLETDLVSILQMLTNHFDQCSKSVKIINNPNTKESEKSQLFNVLSNDVLELPEVLRDLENNYQTIITNSNKINEYVSKSKEIENDSVALLNKLNEFGENKLVESYNVGIEFNSYFLKNFEIIDQELSNIKNLINYYSNFESSYFRLILEINRRSQINLNITNLVNNVTNRLKKIEIEEMELRKKFLLENGDFLPSNIWGGLTSSLPGFDLDHRNEKLPHISEGLLNKAKERLSHE